jgi:hypothetical protein
MRVGFLVGEIGESGIDPGFLASFQGVVILQTVCFFSSHGRRDGPGQGIELAHIMGRRNLIAYIKRFDKTYMLQHQSFHA